jgi:hypothetical protein
MRATQSPAARALTNHAYSDNPVERSPVPDQRALREERLLDVAAALLVRWGYRKTTIDDVAREAGVGKGILREQQRCGEEIQRRIAADPEGGLLHRVTTHGMLAALSHPLLVAIISGKSDIFNGFVEAYNPGFYHQLAGEADTYVVQMQQAGLIRADIPASSITYLLTALKVGMINAPELIGQDRLPAMEELTEVVSDLIRRWLEPEHLPSTSEAGKQLYAEYVDKVKQPE